MTKPPPSVKKLQAEIARLRLRLAELESGKADDDRRESARQRRLSFSETVISSLRDAIYVVDAGDFSLVECNQVFLNWLGKSKQEVIGRPCYEITRGRSEPCHERGDICHAMETASTGEPASSEHTLDTPYGQKRCIECTTLPVFGPAGQVQSIIHVHRDITRRKEAMQSSEAANRELSRANAIRKRLLERFQDANRKLSRSNAFLRKLIMSSVDAVIAADMTGRILIFNEAAGQISGYDEEEALEDLDIRRLYPGDGAREIMAMLRSEAHGGKGKLLPAQRELVRKDGTIIPVILSAAVVTDGEMEMGTVGFFYDLREKLRMEAELDKTRLQLMQAEKMASIGKLAAGVAHQLNNPLAGITLYANILGEEYDLSEQARQDLQRILDNAQRSRDTIKELLQFARQTRQEIRPADLNEALTRTLFLLGNQSQFRNIEIVRRLSPDLPLVPADIQQLNHVFMNIVLNGAEAMSGQGRMEVATHLSPDRKWVVVEIADSGPGIPPEVLPHIFEPFYTTKEEGKGTGLGLSVAFGIVENHGGRLTAQSSPGQGTRFVIELPLGPNAEEKA